MKKGLFLCILLFLSVAYAQTTFSHGIGVVLNMSKDFDNPLVGEEENSVQGFRLGYVADITHDFSQGFTLGGLLSVALGPNIRYGMASLNDSDLESNSLYEDDSTDSFFSFFIDPLELDVKIAPLVGYTHRGYRRPFSLRFTVSPAFISTDFGISAGKESSSMYFGSSFDFSTFITSGNQRKTRALGVTVDYKWLQHKNTGFGYTKVKNYWGIDIIISIRKGMQI